VLILVNNSKQHYQQSKKQFLCF